MTRILQVSSLVQVLSEVFIRPSQELFSNIVEGWILCSCRRFVTAMYQFGDPKQNMAGDLPDDFFFPTDLMLEPALVISQYANRWAIEDTFRNEKQLLGIEQPQSWKKSGPEMVAAVGYAL